MKKIFKLPIELRVSALCAALLALGVTAQVVAGIPEAKAADKSETVAATTAGEGSACATKAAEGGCPFAAMKAKLFAAVDGGCPKAAAAKAAKVADGDVVAAVETTAACDGEGGKCPKKGGNANSIASKIDGAVVAAVEKALGADACEDGVCPLAAKAAKAADSCCDSEKAADQATTEAAPEARTKLAKATE